jgi:hypothetical protein
LQASLNRLDTGGADPEINSVPVIPQKQINLVTGLDILRKTYILSGCKTETVNLK